MKTVLNKSRRPLKIRLSQGRVLHLGPGREGQISTHDADRESLKKLLESGDVELLGDGAATEAGSGSRPGSPLDTRGHHPQTAVKKRGER